MATSTASKDTKTTPTAKTNNLPANLKAREADAPATAVNVMELSATSMKVLYLVATASPVCATGDDAPPQRRLALDGFCKRGLAEPIATEDGKDRLYQLTDNGRVLALLLWPSEVDRISPAPKPAPAKRAPRKPHADKADDTTKEGTAS